MVLGYREISRLDWREGARRWRAGAGLRPSFLVRGRARALGARGCPPRGQQTAGFEEGWASTPSPSNLTREARRRLPRFRQEIKKPPLGGFLYFLAEAVRFELTNGFPRRQFSRLLPSTTRPRFL